MIARVAALGQRVRDRLPFDTGAETDDWATQEQAAQPPVPEPDDDDTKWGHMHHDKPSQLLGSGAGSGS